MSKTALLQVADTGPLESLIYMLSSVGYSCFLPSESLRTYLRGMGCDTVLSPRDLVRGMGYEPPKYEGKDIPEIGVYGFPSVSLFVDVKAHRNTDRILSRHPEMKGRILWYRINGGPPERVPGCGDEIDPPCPILTPNRWYNEAGPWDNRSYSCWPPFYRFSDYFDKLGRHPLHGDPICLVHNFKGWGYGALESSFRRMGVRIYGDNSPDGLVNHTKVPGLLSTAKAYVHLKSSDAPGYALYEALAAACPVICTRRLIWRMHMEDLLIPGETCLVFDRETHEGLNEQDVRDCTSEVEGHLRYLTYPDNNQRIGMAGYRKLKEKMWDKERDSAGLRDFMTKCFPS